MLTFISTIIFLVSSLSPLFSYARANENAATKQLEAKTWGDVNLRELTKRETEKPNSRDVLTKKQKPLVDNHTMCQTRKFTSTPPNSRSTSQISSSQGNEATSIKEALKCGNQTESEREPPNVKELNTVAVATCNGVLAAIAVVFNILMIHFYKSNSGSLSSTLYIRNGVCDLVSALGFLLQVPSVISILDKDTPVFLPLVSYWIVTVSVRMSVFMNCVLGVVRCINILNPFYPVNRKMITISTILYFLLWTTIATLDLWFYSAKIGLQNKVYLVKSLVLKPEPGFSIPSLMTGFKGNKTTSLSQAEVVIAQFLTPIATPALLCFVLMIFQIYHLRQGNEITNQTKKERGNERPMADTRKKKESNNQKAATTILLVTIIYVLTSTLSIVAWLVIYRDELRGGEKIKILSWEELSVIFFSSSTLPLLCSSLTPLTLLLRSSAMQLYLRNTFKRDKAARKQGSSVQRSTELTVKN